MAHTVVAARGFALSAGLRVDAAAVKDATAHRALHIVRQEGRPKSEPQSVNVSISDEHRAMRGVEAVYPRLINRLIRKFAGARKTPNDARDYMQSLAFEVQMSGPRHPWEPQP